MRQYKRKGKLSEERTKKLEDIGFVWRINRGDDDEPPPDKTTRSTRVRKRSVDTDFSDDVWEEKFNDLVEFQKRYIFCFTTVHHRVLLHPCGMLTNECMRESDLATAK